MMRSDSALVKSLTVCRSRLVVGLVLVIDNGGDEVQRGRLRGLKDIIKKH